VLEEVTLSVQAALAARGLRIPYTVFNGGADVFVDVGSKALGIRAVQALVGAGPESTVHVGDRFTTTGNDLRARDVASTLWVTGPAETEHLVGRLIEGVRAQRAAAAAAGAAGAGESGSGDSGSVAPQPGSTPAAPLASHPHPCLSGGGQASHPHPLQLQAAGYPATAATEVVFTPPGTLASPHRHFFFPPGGGGDAASFSLGGGSGGAGAHNATMSLSSLGAGGGGSYVGATVATPLPEGGDWGAAAGAADARTQWAAAGGEVVAEVRPPPAMRRGAFEA
jgi:hypothetical protein